MPLRILRTATIACVIGGLTPTQALAQASVDEIVVSVRKRDEALLRVPVAVTAFDEASIERDRIDSIPDLALRTPGLIFSDPFGRLNPAPGFRGLVQPGIGDEPNVGVFIDGIYVSGRTATNFLAADLERIEVARGPQSALYGRNSFGGAINFVTQRPGFAYGAEAEVTVADNGFREFQGSLEAPIIDDELAVRLTVLDHDTGTDVDNAIAGEAPDIGLVRNTQAIAGITWKPAESVDAYFRFQWSRDNDGQPESFVVPANCAERLSDGALRYFCGEVPGPPDRFAANAEHFGHTRRIYRGSAIIDWRLSDRMTLSSLTGASDQDAEFGFDGDHSPARAYHQGQIIRSWDITQELRLVSQGARLNWVAGANYYRFEKDTVRQDQFFVLGATERGGPITESLTEAGALYGSVDYAVAESWQASAALRYQIERKTFESDSLDAAGNPLDLSDRWDAFLPRLSLSYFPGKDAHLYASVGRGFKSGGFNDDANLFDDQRSFDPDSNWTFETGAKTQWLDGRFGASLTLFWILWNDQQLVAASGAGASNNFFNNNVGESRSRGVELEFNARPLPGLAVDVNYAYADAVFIDYQDPDLRDVVGFAPDGDVSGNRLPRYAPHQVSATTTYERSLGFAALEGYLRVQGLYQSSQFSTPANLARSGDLFRLNLRAGVDAAQWGLSVFAQNAINDRSASVAIRWFDPTDGFGRAWLISPQRERRVGVELRARWPG